MSEAIEVVEGQAIARRVLDALEGGQNPDWAAVDHAYREPLLRQAAARIRRLGLHRQFDPEDVLHDFLQRRVYPARQARKMFSPSARGERPLLPRLLLSLANHCSDMARGSPPRPWGEHEDMLANAPAPGREALPAFEDVTGPIRRQMAAIRDACPLRRRPNGAAYREALLLRLRLDWSGGFDGAELRSWESGRTIVLDLDLLEELTPWTVEEAAMPLVEDGAPLNPLWRQVRAVVLADPNRQAGIDHLERLIPVQRERWYAWVCRGRRMVQARLGPEYNQVFAMWAGSAEGP